ncbi:MAG TPA: hypothetical protein VLI42_01195 [Chthoniobacterales bacterium]|nr:hypothetical protein [Chthoniobacterales bacterium]
MIAGRLVENEHREKATILDLNQDARVGWAAAFAVQKKAKPENRIERAGHSVADRARRRPRLSDDGRGAIDGGAARSAAYRSGTEQRRPRHDAEDSRRRLQCDYALGLSQICDLIRGGGSVVVTTKGELDEAIGRARAEHSATVIEVMLPPEDISPQLKKLSGEVVKRRGKPPVKR